MHKHQHAAAGLSNQPQLAFCLQTQGLAVNRKCRDVLFLLFFVAYWVGMLVVCGIAFREGEGPQNQEHSGCTCSSASRFVDVHFTNSG